VKSFGSSSGSGLGGMLRGNLVVCHKWDGCLILFNLCWCPIQDHALGFHVADFHSAALAPGPLLARINHVLELYC